MQAGGAFEEAAVLSEGGKHAEAETAFAKIAADGTAELSQPGAAAARRRGR